MGYRAADKKEKKESQDLVYDGEVKLAPLLETATDLLVMHEEVAHLQGTVDTLLKSGMWNVPLENTVVRRSLEFVQAQQRSGIPPPSSSHPNPTPSPHFNPPQNPSPFNQNPPPSPSPHFNQKPNFPQHNNPTHAAFPGRNVPIATHPRTTASTVAGVVVSVMDGHELMHHNQHGISGLTNTAGYQGGVNPAGYQGGTNPAGYQGGYQGGTNPAGYQGGTNPAGYQGGTNPAGYQGGTNPAGYQGGMNTAGYQGGTNPAGYQGGTNPAGYQGGTNPAGYQGGYQGGTNPAGYQGGTNPAGYQGGMNPAGYQGGMNPVGYQGGTNPAGYQGGTNPDYANITGGPGNITVTDVASPASNKYGRSAPDMAVQNMGSQVPANNFQQQNPGMNKTYGRPSHIQQGPQVSNAGYLHSSGVQSTPADQSLLYGNIPGPQERKLHVQRQASHQEPPTLPPPAGGRERRRASQPTEYQNYPPSTSSTYNATLNYSSSTAGWDGSQTDNSTVFQPHTCGTIVSDSDSSGAHFSTSSVAPSSPAPHQAHIDQTSGPPRPTVRPTAKPRTYFPSKLTSPEEAANTNIHKLSMDAHQQQSPSSHDSMAANLPPPITDFTTPIDDTPCYESGIQSGLVSGFSNTLGGEGLVPVSLRESGPKGLRDFELARESSSSVGETGVGSPNPPLHHKTSSSSSESSLDLYGSGPTLPNMNRQFSTQQMMRQQSFATVPEEGEGYEQQGGLNMTAPTTTTYPTIFTQGSLDNTPLELSTEQETSLRKLSFSKSRSVDMVEGDGSYHERGHPSLRHVKSGSNLAGLESEPIQREQGRNLDKPQPAPRRSLSPSPPGSREHSPTASPNTARRNRSTHEQWTPTGPSRPFPPPVEATQKPATLPRQAKSVEVEPRTNREVPRYLSGSNLVRDKPTDKPLHFKPAVGKHDEQETPVVGYIPEHLKKLLAATAGKQQQATQGSEVHSQPRAPGRQQQATQGSEVHSQPPVDQPHTHPQNNCGEHLVEKQQLKEQLQQEQEQRMETERKLQREKQEKEEAQKKLRDLQLQLEQQQKKHINFMPPQQKSVAVVSPTNVEGKASLSKPDESRLDKGGEGAEALRQQFAGEGKPRERANADASTLPRPKRPPAKNKPAEMSETSFPEPPVKEPTAESNAGTQKAPDIATHTVLDDHWVCDYCTNLNSDSLHNCDVCKRPDPRNSWLCLNCKNHNHRSLGQCKTCNSPRVTTV